MRSVYKRNTGRTICRMSFIDEQKNLDKLERVSKRRTCSQSEVIREGLRDYLRNWDC